MKSHIVAIGLLSILVFPVFAEKLSLPEIIQLAVSGNPAIAAAKRSWQAAQSREPQTVALKDPTLGLEYEQIPSGSRNLEDGMKMFTAEQMIMFPGKIYAEWQMAGAESDREEANYRAKLLEITSQVKASYYDLFYADRAIETMTEIKGLLGRVEKSAEAKYVVGEVGQADVLMANVEYLLMDNELTTLRQERQVKEAKLKALLDRSDEGSLETAVVLDLPGTIGSAAAWEKRALDNRPELLAMKAELAVKDANHLRSKMEYFPDTTLGVKKRVGDGWDAMLSFSVPLYFWKQAYGVNSLGLEREAAEASYANMRNLTRWMVQESWVMADAARRTAQLYEEKIVPQSSQALKVALTAYRSSKVDFQTLQNIERAYKEARLKLYESQVKFGQALAELEKITGGEIK